eukprot:scaffold2821_cov240-Pinguiococcus_pyrenoidosus.AAC.3
MKSLHRNSSIWRVGLDPGLTAKGWSEGPHVPSKRILRNPRLLPSPTNEQTYQLLLPKTPGCRRATLSGRSGHRPGTSSLPLPFLGSVLRLPRESSRLPRSTGQAYWAGCSNESPPWCPPH